VPDLELHARLMASPAEGWRLFVDAYTPLILSLIDRAGIEDRDDMTDVYVTVCERLSANGHARLRAHDPRKGALAAWLTTVVRHAAVDWVRSRAGRRRLFRAVKRLPLLDQTVFALYYWEGRQASEIAETLRSRGDKSVGVPDVLDSLARLDGVLSDRQRRQLSVLVTRNAAPVSLDDVPPAASAMPAPLDPELRLRVRALDEAMRAALREMPAEDAAIVRLLFVQGWTRADVARALHLGDLTAARVQQILQRLREKAAALSVTPSDVATPGLSFLEDPRT
jgi:DNA-directed RNA polymerase specialized sigma24 family protein